MLGEPQVDLLLWPLRRGSPGNSTWYALPNGIRHANVNRAGRSGILCNPTCDLLARSAACPDWGWHSCDRMLLCLSGDGGFIWTRLAVFLHMPSTDKTGGWQPLTKRSERSGWNLSDHPLHSLRPQGASSFSGCHAWSIFDPLTGRFEVCPVRPSRA